MIIKKVRETIRKYNLIKKDDSIIIGVSGGPDSVALLYLLNSLKKEFKLSLCIVHLDHMLRKDSQEDAEFVEGLARRLKVPIITAQINIRELAIKGSVEEIARNARLGLLFKVAKAKKTAKIALGHNLDDRVETVLMRILRGTGLYGLAGILPKRNFSKFQIIRPLIEVRRKEITAYLARKKIKPRIDKTNLDDVYLRNKIRNKLLPLLEKEYNRNVKAILSNMSESSGCDYDYLISKAEITARHLGRKINLVKFMRLHPAMQRLILRINFARLKGDTRRITFQHIREIEDLITSRPVNSIVDLPKGISVVKGKTYLSFYHR